MKYFLLIALLISQPTFSDESESAKADTSSELSAIKTELDKAMLELAELLTRRDSTVQSKSRPELKHAEDRVNTLRGLYRIALNKKQKQEKDHIASTKDESRQVE